MRLLLAVLLFCCLIFADDESAFLEAIRKNPADDTARLVYADWLEEHEQGPRAEFIRIQVQLARIDIAWDSLSAKTLRHRADELKQHAIAWLPPDLPESVKRQITWERGLPSELFVRAQDLESPKALRALNAMRFLNCINLELTDALAGDIEAAVAIQQNLGRLTLLNQVPYVKLVSGLGQIHPTSLAAVLSTLPLSVRHLWIHSHDLQPFNSDHMLALVGLSHLEELELSGVTVSDASLDTLGRSSLGQRLKSLVATPNSLEPIRKTGNFSALEQLHVYHPGVAAATHIAEFVRSEKFTQLKALSLPHLGAHEQSVLEREASGDRNHLLDLKIGGQRPDQAYFPNVVRQIAANVAANPKGVCSLVTRLVSEN